MRLVLDLEGGHLNVDGVDYTVTPQQNPVPQPPPAPEKLPRLTGDQFDRMVRTQRTAQYDAVLAAELGDQYGNYVNYAYGPSGYYWIDILDAPMQP